MVQWMQDRPAGGGPDETQVGAPRNPDRPKNLLHKDVLIHTAVASETSAKPEGSEGSAVILSVGLPQQEAYAERKGVWLRSAPSLQNQRIPRLGHFEVL